MKSLKHLFLKILNISTLLTLTPRSSLPKKKIYIFLHVAKSGGSSFWNSLVNSINSSNNKYNFAIDDTYERAIKEFGIPSLEAQNKATILILKDFISCPLENLVLHYHANGENLDNLFPKDLKPYYILLFRNAEERLISSYKWYLITKLDSKKSYSNTIRKAFFEDFLSQGYQIILTNVFSMDYGSLRFKIKQKKRLLPLTLEDYNNPTKSSRNKKLLSFLNLDLIKPTRIKETMTSEQYIKPNLPEKNEINFWKEMDKLANKEEKFNRYILNNC